MQSDGYYEYSESRQEGGSVIIKEVIKVVEVVREVIKVVEVIREVPVEVVKEVIKEVPVEVVREVLREVPREELKVVEMIKEVAVPTVREVPKETVREIVKQVRVEVPIDVVRHVEVEVPVELIREIPVELQRGTWDHRGGGDHAVDLIKVIPPPAGAVAKPMRPDAWGAGEPGGASRTGMSAKQMRGRPNTLGKTGATGWSGSQSSTKSTSKTDGSGLNVSGRPITGHNVWGSRSSR